MPAEKTRDPARLVNSILKKNLRDATAVGAWTAFIAAYATLMRQLNQELKEETGADLGDFDVLAQLAIAGGELRMTDLATRVFLSRSAMTRRVARMVDDKLLRRGEADTDGRGVVVSLTSTGVERLAEIAPVHLRGVSSWFVERLDAKELAALERTLNKVVVRECSFG